MAYFVVNVADVVRPHSQAGGMGPDVRRERPKAGGFARVWAFDYSLYL